MHEGEASKGGGKTNEETLREQAEVWSKVNKLLFWRDTDGKWIEIKEKHSNIEFGDLFLFLLVYYYWFYYF